MRPGPLRDFPFAVLLLAATALFASAPACGSSHPGFASDSGSDATTGDDAGDDSQSLGEGGSHGAVTALAITPAASTLLVTNPMAPPTATLTAVATYADGTMGPVGASWTLDRLDIASIGAGNGVVTPTASTFGTAKVTAAAGGQKASATVTVSLKATLDLGNVSSGDRGLLDGATMPIRPSRRSPTLTMPPSSRAACCRPSSSGTAAPRATATRCTTQRRASTSRSTSPRTRRAA